MMMKSLLLLSLCALPAVGMCPQEKQNYLKNTALALGLATTHTTASVYMVAKSSGMLPLAVTVGIALGSDYLLTKYAKDSK
jgi:hypothetical protein